MKNTLISCLRTAGHLILCWSIPLALVLASGNYLYASDTDHSKGFSSKNNPSNYGKRYSNNILRGVKLSDVFTFNDTKTTILGPAYANIWTFSSNFLACSPPAGRPFSYALCYYSGPDGPTGNQDDNPSLPCTLSPDGVVANCTCLEIPTEVASPKIPYFVDINAITMIEQGSGVCVWKGHCEDNYQPGISDHDFEVFFPEGVSEEEQQCVTNALFSQVLTIEGDPKTIHLSSFLFLYFSRSIRRRTKVSSSNTEERTVLLFSLKKGNKSW